MIKVATYSNTCKSLESLLNSKFFNLNKNIVIRLGGTRNYSKYEYQINTSTSVNNSCDKLATKQLFKLGKVSSLPYLESQKLLCFNEDMFNEIKRSWNCDKLLLKKNKSSGGNGIIVISTLQELFDIIKVKKYKGYIEPYLNVTSEYRVHYSKWDKVFFTVKKIKKNPSDLIIDRDNHFNIRTFLKPRKWAEILIECEKAANVLGLDICCFDVLYNSENHVFFISEVNTGPELLRNTKNKYFETIVNYINTI